MAEIQFNQAYENLTDAQKRQFDGVMGMGGFNERYQTNPESTLVTSDPDYKLFSPISKAYKDSQTLNKGSSLNPLNWNLFGSADASEMPQNNKYGLVNTDIASQMYTPEMQLAMFGDENYLGNNQTNNLPFTSMADMAAANQNFMKQFKTGEDYNMSGPLRGTNVMEGSVIGPDMSISDYQYPSGTDILGMDESVYNYKMKPDTFKSTSSPPEWMVGKDPMGKGRLLGEDQFGEVWGTPPKSKFAQGIETLTSKLPSMQMLSNLSQMLPVNERAIMERNLGNQGIYTDDIGRIVQAGSDYNDPRNVMKDYNAFQMTDKTFDKRTDRIEKTLRDKYNMTDAEIADVYAGSYKGDVTSDLMKRLRNIKTSKNVIMQQKEFATQMADQRREAKEQAKLNQLSRAQARADRANIQKIQTYTGRPLSDYRMSRPASERQYTGHGKSGMGRDRSKLMAYGGRVGYANGGLASLFTRRG